MARKRGRRQRTDNEVASQLPFFMANTSEHEARGLAGKQRREGAARGFIGPKPIRMTRHGEPYLQDLRARNGKTVQCANCHAVLYPPGQPNPGHSLHREGRGFSDSECRKCRRDRMRTEATGRGISVAELERRYEASTRQRYQGGSKRR